MPYLIDGNNLLGSWGGPRGSDRRGEVVRRVAAFCRSRGASATIVFDGRALRGDRESQQLGPVSIRVPPRGVDADTLIRSIVDDSPRPSEITVVTSDKALYSYCRTRGAGILRAHEWNSFERRVQGERPDRAAEEKPASEADVEGWLRVFESSPDPVKRR